MTPKPFSVALHSASVGEEYKDNRNARPSTRTASAGANSGNLRSFQSEQDSDNAPHLNRFAIGSFLLAVFGVMNIDKWFIDFKQWLLYRRECLCGECMEGFCMAPNVEDGKCGRCERK